MLRLCAGFWGWESRQIPEDTDLWSHTGVRSREASSGRIITCHSSKICDEGKEKAVGGSNTAFASSFEGVCQHGIPTGRTGRSQDVEGKGDPRLDVDVLVLPPASTFPQVVQKQHQELSRRRFSSPSDCDFMFQRA